MARIFGILILCGLTGGIARGVEVSRVIKTFDFEERGLGNQEDLPMHWSKVVGPGLPHYVNGRLATDRHRGGQYSFRFDLNGGSLIYRYDPGLIRVDRGAHYRIEGFCQTTVLPNARARLTAYFVDSRGRTIEDSVRHSDLYAAKGDDEAWKNVGVSLTADSSDAQSIGIELELLQPANYQPSGSAGASLFNQDIRGSAWWDDITVRQVPVVTLSTDHAANIFGRDEPLRVLASISDQTYDDLILHVSVMNAASREVYQRTGAAEFLPAPAGEKTQSRQMWLDLPSMLPGWYQVTVATSSGTQALASRTLNLIVLADAGQPSQVDPRFGLVATGLNSQQWKPLADILPLIPAGRVKVTLWDAHQDVEAAHSDEFEALLARLDRLNIATTACLTAPPPGIAAKLGAPGWDGLSKLKPEDWQPQLSYLISRHSIHIARWQLGADGSFDFVSGPSRQSYDAVFGVFGKLTVQPDLAMPWPASIELPGKAPGGISLYVPTSILPSQIPLYVQDLKGQSDHPISLVLAALDRGQYGRAVQIRDFAQRFIYALTADAPAIDLPLPIATVEDDSGARFEPQELLIIIRTLTTTLSGARYKGKIAVGDGIDAFLFDRDGKGIIALWSKADSPGTKELSLNLGQRPLRLDLWGNAAPLLKPPGEKQDRVLLILGSMPIFLVDIDGPQAQLRASVALDQPLLESTFHPHERHIKFVNAYNQAITGSAHVKAPRGWTLNPPTFNFTLNPGETFDGMMTIQFPYNSVAGEKTLECEFVIAEQPNPSFSVPITVKLGLSDVGMQSFALRDGHDIFVQQEITNYGEHPINYTVFAMYPDQARQERLVYSLAPGATTIRKYRFVNVSPTQTAPVRVGLKELQGNRILNDSVEVR